MPFIRYIVTMLSRSVPFRQRLATILASAALLTTSFAQDQTGAAASKLESLLYHIDRMYVDEVNKDELVEAAIVRMLEQLDPHSVYIPKEELEEVNEPLKGNFDGIGVQFNLIRDTIYVVDAIAGGPSERLGIRAGDRIITINDTVVAGVGFKNSDVMSRLRGRKGTKVKVGIQRRAEPQLLEFVITRDKIPIFSVEAAYMATPKVGYIKVSRFSATTMKEFRTKLGELKAAGMQDLILDLQGNGGGYLRTAIEMSDEFLGDRRLIVYTEGRNAPRDETFATKEGGFEKGRLAVLVDEGSASASEIVSGAVQDWDRGLIVGRRSFGKGLVQRPVMLPDGSAVRLTVSRYFTPSGRCIQKSYEEGVEAYQQEKTQRLQSGELTSVDSLHPADTVKYYTMNKRVVYGGGGISPDLFVPIDTSQSSNYFGQLVRRGVLNTFALQYVDEQRNDLLKSYPTAKAFLDGFTVSEALLELLVTEAESEGITRDDSGIARSGELLNTRLKALIARDLWDTSAYWMVINAENPVDRSFQRALEALTDNTYTRLGMAR